MNLHWIVAIVGCWANGIVEGQISKRLEELTSTQRIEVLKRAYWALSDWPSKFTTFLDQCRGLARQPKSCSLMNQEFGALFDSLAYKIRDPNIEFIRDEMKNYGKSLSQRDEIETLDDVCLVNLSKETGIGISALRKMFESGAIKIFRERRGYTKDRYVISENCLNELRCRLTDNITLQELSVKLGLGIKITAKLRDEGLFHADSINLRDGRSDKMYSKKEAEDLLNSVVNKAIQLGDLPADQYQHITDAMRIFCINGITGSELLGDALTGALPTYRQKQSENLGGIFVQRGEIKEYVLEKINPDRDLVSVEVAAKEFDLSDGKVKSLAKSGVVSSKVVTHGARKYRLISRNSFKAWVGTSAP